MHVIVIGWLFVAFMLAVGQHSVVGGAISFFMWGVVPSGLIVYIFGRRRRQPAATADDSTE